MRLPPLESLRVFEAAARHDSFARAADELCVTPAAVAHRVKTLEQFLDMQLFTRHHRGVRLNKRGKSYLVEIQRILADIHDTTEQLQKNRERKHLKIVSVEVFAEKWLMPRLADFQERYPGIAIDLHTDHRNIDPIQQGHDVWITYRDTIPPPLISETLFEERLLPVCSPSLLELRGRPQNVADLLSWPLLYDLLWADDWAHWFAHHHVPAPDLSCASGFRLYSMLIQGAVNGMGVAIGHASMIANELESGALVALFDESVVASDRFLLVTTPNSQKKKQVKAFRDWIVAQAAPEGC